MFFIKNRCLNYGIKTKIFVKLVYEDIFIKGK